MTKTLSKMSHRKKESSKKTSRVLANRYEIVKKLGKGNFGTAYLCKDLRSKNPDTEEYDLKVLKEISVGDLQPDETVDAVREARVLSKLDHPSIVKFHDSFIDGESFCIVTEYCEGGDLDCKINECVKNKQQLDSKLIMDWFVQLLLAVHYMHQRRVLHRDLKTRNIFLRQNMIKIGDFGISRILMGTTDLASTFTGTPYYMSPEVLKHEGYNSKSDIWSIGCILYEMCTLEHAFDGKSLMAVMYKIVEGEVPKLPDKFSELNNVLKLMLSKDPEKRPSATDLLKVPMIKNHIAKLSKEFHAKSQENSSRDAEDIAKLLTEKSYLSDLKSREEEVKLKNLPPRERMRLRKLQQADMEAKRLREVAKVQLKENQERNSRIQSTLHKSSVPAWAGGSGEGEMFKAALTVKGGPTIAAEGQKSRFGSRTAPILINEDDEESDDDADIVMPLSKTLTVPRSVSNPDERPITPLKDKMIYDIRNSSLDFKDGIPENPELADTYYSQFDNDFSGDDSESDEAEETVIERTVKANKSEASPYQGTEKSRASSNLGTLVDDEDQLYNIMQDVLAKGDDAESTMSLADDKEAGAFGPVVREQKIKNLTKECKRILGEEAFQKAYDYLKQARYLKTSSVDSEETIMQGLREFVKNPSDCFLVDQLLFLEEQAKIPF
ncbi:serine/threonine-protein kinase Nek11-like [Saccostrea echinata]|uniref:serine/threonine-protein kinase Nek11-like n=1 Tax=Saccostrea echinata TaxID=191078 RepID=UPI002A7FF4AC|nr:serine/threonine-protein kinase Nek11-like [Saccostrea echinata]